MSTTEEQLSVAAKTLQEQHTPQHSFSALVMSTSSALDTARSRACGRCQECMLRLAILAFGAEHKWLRFFYNVCSASAEGEYYWHLFVYMHELDDLRWVMRSIEKERKTGESTSPVTLAATPAVAPSSELWN